MRRSEDRKGHSVTPMVKSARFDSGGRPMTLRQRRLFYRTSAWQAARAAALARAGYRCQRCGGAGRLEVHHVESLARGGAPLDEANLQALCRRCHFQSEQSRRPVGAAAAGEAWREAIDATST